ncbi:MAG: hypothetical protein ACOCVL_01495 [Candidatus Sumerlaeota bacterium]
MVLFDQYAKGKDKGLSLISQATRSFQRRHGGIETGASDLVDYEKRRSSFKAAAEQQNYGVRRLASAFGKRRFEKRKKSSRVGGEKASRYYRKKSSRSRVAKCLPSASIRDAPFRGGKPPHSKKLPLRGGLLKCIASILPANRTDAAKDGGGTKNFLRGFPLTVRNHQHLNSITIHRFRRLHR